MGEEASSRKKVEFREKKVRGEVRTSLPGHGWGPASQGQGFLISLEKGADPGKKKKKKTVKSEGGKK